MAALFAFYGVDKWLPNRHNLDLVEKTIDGFCILLSDTSKSRLQESPPDLHAVVHGGGHLKSSGTGCFSGDTGSLQILHELIHEVKFPATTDSYAYPGFTGP